MAGRLRIMFIAGVWLLATASLAVAAHDGDLRTRLTGEKEVPGPGDPDATGTAFVTFDEGKNTICWVIWWRKLQQPTAAHIHRGDRDEAGPAVVTLFDRDDRTSRRSHDGCVVVSHALWNDIQRNPEDYYVNVHNNRYPRGAIRGQLHDDQ